MKVCKVCGCKIFNGVNGCVLSGNICFECNPVTYTNKPISLFGMVISDDDLDALENRCVDDIED